MGVSGNPLVLAGLIRRLPFIDPGTFRSDFDERLILQKAFYLIQEGQRVPMGYEFNWYHHGPYSSVLTRDAYQAVESAGSIRSRRFVEVEIEKRFAAAINWLSHLRKDPAQFELLGSVLWLQRHGYSEEQSKPILIAKIPGVDTSRVSKAWAEIAKRFPVSPSPSA